MKIATPSFRPAHRTALGAACVLLLIGCRGEKSPGDDRGHDDDHAGHVIPAHKPKGFPDAVRRLRELNDKIVAKGQPASSPDRKNLDVALDIANWLPEIAADSDLPEKPWDEVSARSAAIVADYQMIRSGVAADGSSNPVDDAGKAITELETILAAADPRWFAGPEKRGAVP